MSKHYLLSALWGIAFFVIAICVIYICFTHWASVEINSIDRIPTREDIQRNIKLLASSGIGIGWVNFSDESQVVLKNKRVDLLRNVILALLPVDELVSDPLMEKPIVIGIHASSDPVIFKVTQDGDHLIVCFEGSCYKGGNADMFRTALDAIER